MLDPNYSKDLEFEEETHIYRYKGRRFMSVTQVLETVGISDFSMVPAKILERAQNYGTAVHKTIELFEKNELDEDSLDLRLVEVLEQWKTFKKDLNVNILLSEQKLFSLKYCYAGTMDAVLTLDHGPISILDIKTGQSYPSHQIQTSAYEQLWRENRSDKHPRLVNRYTLLISDESYQLVPNTTKNDLNVFLSAVQVVNYKGS
ncbi:hypothetical protein LCGC14_0452140 [marine sediment metagenome]|uniref:PD-(D/E)XK endonuclease-like domain-containing protein n=1 Tax=marine sediment metagenome TaxID=412755 RepID=A0A0F9VRG5_9ZZZZ